ncbi:LacI family DNA-binding transcriptional regulator [Microbacterium sp. 22242]|uniref:LacI family DNA-binding transcriptional regulator n=1 Tax=Microbacterium sp. 22242 TaxID=3453896 RepID=UPI003F84EF17
MTDVARHAGVAVGTVSNTLNNPEKVADATRRRVLASIAELGFVRNDAARSLAAGSSSTIGLVIADLGNSYFVDIARGADDAVRRRRMNVLIANSDVDMDRERRNLELFEQARVAGIIMAPLDTPLARSQVLPIRATPTVFVNFESDVHKLSAVAVDERHGGALAAGHLLQLGRRRILFVGGPMLLSAVRGRREGAEAEVAGCADATFEVLETQGVNIRHGRDASREVLRRGPGAYDGIVCASDLLAIGLTQALTETAGFRVPDDIAVTGYDNNHFASESSLPITTVSQPGEEMGRVAADLLLEQIADPSTPPRTVVLPPRLIPRRSTLGDLWRRD